MNPLNALRPRYGAGLVGAHSDSQDAPPRPDEFELSLIGPGYGECVMLHLGGGAWVVVDSCIDIRTGTPVALGYLRLLGVDANAVKLVVATHWHDDHIRGLTQVLEAATKARFLISTALRSHELATLVALVEPRMMLRSSGVSELAKVHNHLAATHSQLQFAAPDRRIWQGAGSIKREIWSLTPSDGSIELAIQGIASLFDDPNLPNRRIPSLTPNHASIVLWAEMAGVIALLGGDLENTAEDTTGWRAVVASTARPGGQAACFKVPHHGSVSGHNDDVWESMLDADAVAVVTPFARGRTSLPTAADANRMCTLAGSAYITTIGQPPRTEWPPPVASVLSETTVAISDAEPLPGQIRLRKRPTDEGWTVELFGGASSICD